MRLFTWIYQLCCSHRDDLYRLERKGAYSVMRVCCMRCGRSSPGITIGGKHAA